MTIRRRKGGMAVWLVGLSLLFLIVAAITGQSFWDVVGGAFDILAGIPALIANIGNFGPIGGGTGGTGGDLAGGGNPDTMDVVVVPFLYNPSSADVSTYEDDVDEIRSQFLSVSPFREQTGSEMTITTADRTAITNPSTRSVSTDIGDYAALDCRDAFDAAVEAAQDQDLLTQADFVLAYVSGEASGNTVTLVNGGEIATAGCAWGVPGEISAVERSDIGQSPAQYALHELGHSIGLCHTAGEIDVSGVCDESAVPARAGTCLNDEGSIGARAVMNHCSPWEEYTTEPDGNTYDALKSELQERGWMD